MAKTIRSGYFLGNSASTTLHSAAGRLLAVLVSNAQATVQTVTFYDATAATPGTEILILDLPTGQAPYYFQFPRDQAISFSTGLHVTTGTCTANIWSVDHG
jgi:hypothetical protein